MSRPMLPALLSAMALLTACGTAVSSRPCPRVTEFPIGLQRDAGRELVQMQLANPGAALPRMMDALAADRAFNRAVCP
jgi:hypothetical protein